MNTTRIEYSNKLSSLTSLVGHAEKLYKKQIIIRLNFSHYSLYFTPNLPQIEYNVLEDSFLKSNELLPKAFGRPCINGAQWRYNKARLDEPNELPHLSFWGHELSNTTPSKNPKRCDDTVLDARYQLTRTTVHSLAKHSCARTCLDGRNRGINLYCLFWQPRAKLFWDPRPALRWPALVWSLALLEASLTDTCNIDPQTWEVARAREASQAPIYIHIARRTSIVKGSAVAIEAK
jgi:hypothetical protein